MKYAMQQILSWLEGHKNEISDLLHIELDLWSNEEIIDLEWQITIDVKYKNKNYSLNLWEFKNINEIKEAIDHGEWKVARYTSHDDDDTGYHKHCDDRPSLSSLRGRFYPFG